MLFPRLRPALVPRGSQRFFSGGAAKPGWTVSKTNQYGPETLDRQYFWEHPIYTGFTLWVRGVRPYIEKIAGDTAKTLKSVTPYLKPVKDFAVRHNPDVRYDLRRLQSLEQAKALKEEGFFRAESDDLDQRSHDYASDHQRLTDLWEATMASAAEKGAHGFGEFCAQLDSSRVDPETIPQRITPPITWRFNMIPYGADEESAKTFEPPSHEQPHRSFALNFTYNNLAANWGDYIDRQDNKGTVMRPVRQMFTDVYIPPTK